MRGFRFCPATTAGKSENRSAAKRLRLSSMRAINPDIEITGHYINAKTPIDFRCKSCGLVDSAAPRSLLRGTGCKVCARKRSQALKAKPESVFLEQAHKQYPYIEIIGKYTRSNDRILCRCTRCNHEWSPFAHALVSGKSGCPSCAGIVKKQVKCIETGVIYNSIKTAEQETGISHSRISMCCNQKASTAGRFHWEFAIKDVVP